MSTLSEPRTALPTGTWQIDPVHSTVEFSVKHMVVAMREVVEALVSEATARTQAA